VLIGLGVIIVCRGADQDSAIRIVDVLLDTINGVVNLWDSCSSNLLEPNEETVATRMCSICFVLMHVNLLSNEQG
jgi:hypothetical protein